MIGQENITFQYGDSITRVPYIPKNKPKIIISDENLEGEEYDLPYLWPDQKGVILVHEVIPYEGIMSSVTIYDQKGHVVHNIDLKDGSVEMAPQHSFFVFIEN